MIQKYTLDFLKSLKKNNNKPWFDANKKAYEEARGAFTEATTQVISILSKIDGDIAHLTAK
jgi:uncharacterized protein (DUF2461 family)